MPSFQPLEYASRRTFLPTPYHAKYYAHALTRRRASDDPDKLGSSLMNASVDLNPHQIDAAMFAFRSPLSRGAILADEVGLGKTIEAGLIISQLWAERKRRILIIVPTTLRKQWAQELSEKFFLETEIFDVQRFNAALRQRPADPFGGGERILLCSYHFARSAQAAIEAVAWDLVVIDEAHRLRNVLKSGNKIAKAIKDALRNARGKVLLTATPLQNSLLELYALTGFLDEHLFGDLQSFKEQFLRGPLGASEFRELRRRLQPICQRTLRRQVEEYVRYTNRIPMVHDLTPGAAEQKLYEEVSEYLRRDQLFALPRSQRKLMILVLRKLLASSTFAIAGTLESLRARVAELRYGLPAATADDAAGDFEHFQEVAEEWADEQGDPGDEDPAAGRAALEAEIGDLVRFRDLATSITENAKGEKLLQALRAGFKKLESLGALPKAVIFTESRRTQQYLFDHLEANGYAGRVMTFNGTNTDSRSAEIYKTWKGRHEGEPVATGRKEIDMRAALIEHFREEASVMIATEAAAEGVNLQFCSLVVNYDLPWNPQRIEQRIGRCHRYGQKHDVVVINFLNRANEADVRVFQILDEKFRLFDGVFGASDEVLGSIESGVDFERRVAEIYQTCRTPSAIDAAFNALQREMSEQIDTRMSETRATLLEHFDQEVQDRLRLQNDSMGARLERLDHWLWQLARFELRDHARFEEEQHRFFVPNRIPGCVDAPTGTWRLLARGEVPADHHHSFRLGDRLAQFLIDRSKERRLDPAAIVFEYTNRKGGRVALVEQLLGAGGWLSVAILRLEGEQQQEDYLLFSGFLSSGEEVHPESLEKLIETEGRLGGRTEVPFDVEDRLAAIARRQEAELRERLADRNGRFFEEEIEKLDRWAEDRKKSLEADLRMLKSEISLAKKAARVETSLEGKVAMQRKAKDLEAQLTRKRREMFEAEDEIDRQKEQLISTIEQRLKQSARTETLFTIEWRVQ